MNIDKSLYAVNGYSREKFIKNREKFIESYTHKWHVNGKEIKLFLKDTENYLIVSENNNFVKKINLTKKRAEDIFQKDQICFRENGRIDICPVLFKIKFDKIKLSLLESRFGLMWQVFDRVTKKTQWQKFSATFVSSSCHRETWHIFEKIKEDWQNNPRNADLFEENFVVSDVIFLKESKEHKNHNFDQKSFNLNFELEDLAEYRWKEECDLKKAHAVEKAKAISYWHWELINQGEDKFVYGGSEQRTIFEKNEKKYAIYNEIIGNLDSRILDHIQESQLLDRERLQNQQRIDKVKTIQFPLYKFFPPQDLIISNKIKPLIENIFPFYVVIEPKTFPCTLDQNVLISPFRWAVTVICNANGKWGQHAEVIVQGISNGKILTILSHLKSENEVDVEFIEANKLEFVERTEVWLVKAKKINKMICSMMKEQLEKNTKFSFLGSYSLLSGGGDNCFTWAQSHLKRIGIDLGWPGFGIFFTQPKSYTQKPGYYLENLEYPKI